MLTDHQRRYAEARMAGNAKKTSALMAGVPERTASSAATKLEKHPKVIAHWERHGWTPPAVEKMGPKKQATPKPKEVIAAEHIPETERMAEKPVPRKPDTKFTDPRKFMESIMNDGGEDPKLRLEAAKALAQYTLTKPLPKKDDGKGKAAKEAAKRFGAIAPPSLRSVK